MPERHVVRKKADGTNIEFHPFSRNDPRFHGYIVEPEDDEIRGFKRDRYGHGDFEERVFEYDPVYAKFRDS